MKRLVLYFLIVFSAAAGITSCNKNANVSPTNFGNQSFTSMLVSPTGTIMYIGNVLPTLSIGAVGDYYLDVANGNIYGPKTSTSWGRGFSLKGPAGATGATGAAGKAGSQIYSGSGVPSAGLGLVGDYYLDTTNFLL